MYQFLTASNFHDVGGEGEADTLRCVTKHLPDPGVGEANGKSAAGLTAAAHQQESQQLSDPSMIVWKCNSLYRNTQLLLHFCPPNPRKIFLDAHSSWKHMKRFWGT